VKVGDLVKNKNSESGELGLFIGLRVFQPTGWPESVDGYECAEVYWPDREKIGTIQTDLLEVIK